MRRFTLPVALFFLLSSVGFAAWFGKHTTTTSREAKKERATTVAPFFGNQLDPITGKPVNHSWFVEYRDPDTHTFGRIYLSSWDSKAAVERDLAGIYKRLYLHRVIKDKDGRVIVEQGQPVNVENETCPIMGGKIDGKTFLVYNGYRVNFCCPGCDTKFMENPEVNLAKLIRDQKLAVPGLERGTTVVWSHEHMTK